MAVRAVVWINFFLSFVLRGKKPKKWVSPLKPEIDIEAERADGPGIAYTGIFSICAVSTIREPGSEIPGVPASDVNAAIPSRAIASILGVEERVIAISFVAIGTSIPELATTVIAISKKEFELIIGNILGSNIFNILAILGVSGLITEIKIENRSSILTDAIFMLSISILIFFLFKFSQKKSIGRVIGFLLFASYISYIIFVFK